MQHRLYFFPLPQGQGALRAGAISLNLLAQPVFAVNCPAGSFEGIVYRLIQDFA